MNNRDDKVIGCEYLDKERYENVLALGNGLNRKGVNGKRIPLDGDKSEWYGRE
jgi:hypothetical protein